MFEYDKERFGLLHKQTPCLLITITTNMGKDSWPLHDEIEGGMWKKYIARVNNESGTLVQ